jgi:DNA-directed RNA polymerase specialized sigma24 family protein
MEGYVDYEKIRRQCEAFARRKGFSQDAEDFASYVMLDAIEHNSDSVFIGRRFVDYLRKHYGRTGTPGGDARQRASLRPVELVEERHGSESPVGFNLDESGVYLSGLSQQDRLIYVLTQKHEVPHITIADSLGVSESRVSQVLARIQQRVSERVKTEMSRAEGTRTQEVARVLPAKGKGVELRAHFFLEAGKSIQMAGFDEAGL